MICTSNSKKVKSVCCSLRQCANTILRFSTCPLLCLSIFTFQVIIYLQWRQLIFFSWTQFRYFCFSSRILFCSLKLSCLEISQTSVFANSCCNYVKFKLIFCIGFFQFFSYFENVFNTDKRSSVLGGWQRQILISVATWEIREEYSTILTTSVFFFLSHKLNLFFW